MNTIHYHEEYPWIESCAGKRGVVVRCLHCIDNLDLPIDTHPDTVIVMLKDFVEAHQEHDEAYLRKKGARVFYRKC